jgi:hypothetical protein
MQFPPAQTPVLPQEPNHFLLTLIEQYRSFFCGF